MKEITGDIWEYHERGEYIAITTNGSLNSRGELVMARGIALAARERWPRLPLRLGGLVEKFGNAVYVFPDLHLVTFPVKHHFYEKADLELIETSCMQLIRHPELDEVGDVYLPRPGCANGRLAWAEVKPVLEKHLDDSFIVVHDPGRFSIREALIETKVQMLSKGIK